MAPIKHKKHIRKQKHKDTWYKNPAVVAILVFTLIGIFATDALTGGYLADTANFQLDILQASAVSRQTLVNSSQTIEVYAGEPAVGNVSTSSYRVQLGTAATLPTCGNIIIEAPEQCDGSDLSGKTCFSVGFLTGGLSCNADCTYNRDECVGFDSGAILGFLSQPKILAIVLDPGESGIFGMKFGDSLSFDLEGEGHSIRVSGVFDSTVELQISSNHTNRYNFSVGETRTFDLTENGIDDVGITIVDKTENQVQMMLRSLEGQIIIEPSPELEIIEAPEPELISAPTAFFFAPDVSTTSGQIFFAIILISVVVAAGLSIRRVARKRKSRIAMPIVDLTKPPVQSKQERLREYVSKAQARGVTKESLQKSLLERGWNKEMVENTLSEIYGEQ